MEATETTTLVWKRIGDGEYADTTSEFTISRHEVDDREVDGGYLMTWWNVSQHDNPFEQAPRLRDAKRTCQRIVDRRAL